MPTAYFDCFSGISGDMILGALVDGGLPFNALTDDLSRLPLSGYRLIRRRTVREGISATKIDVVVRRAKQPARRLADIQSILRRSRLSPAVVRQSLAVFRTLASAEARVHRTTIGRVHFHEVGAVDALVDVVGAISGLHRLGIDRVIASPINMGSGWIRSEHGRLPVPAPATLEILRGAPMYSSGVEKELATPTGAAILSTVCAGYGPMPLLRVRAAGYGAGTAAFREHPNVLRIVIGEEVAPVSGNGVAVIETNIDDMNPQIYEHVSERLFSAGALDVYLTPVIMKKGRPGQMVSILVPVSLVDEAANILFSETTTLGVRIHPVSRRILNREIRIIRTRYGPIRVKIGRRDGLVKSAPEYADCKAAAKKSGVPLRVVMQAAERACRPKGRGR